MLQSGCLAFALRTEHDVHLRIGGQEFVGTVVAAVGNPHDAELILRIVECQRVGHLLGDNIFLVVGADHERHGGQFFVAGHDGLTGFSREEPFKLDNDIQ